MIAIHLLPHPALTLRLGHGNHLLAFFGPILTPFHKPRALLLFPLFVLSPNPLLPLPLFLHAAVLLLQLRFLLCIFLCLLTSKLVGDTLQPRVFQRLLHGLG